MCQQPYNVTTLDVTNQQNFLADMSEMGCCRYRHVKGCVDENPMLPRKAQLPSSEEVSVLL